MTRSKHRRSFRAIRSRNRASSPRATSLGPGACAILSGGTRAAERGNVDLDVDKSACEDRVAEVTLTRACAREFAIKPSHLPSVPPFGLFRWRRPCGTVPAVRRPVYLRSDDELMGIPAAFNVCSVCCRNSRFVAREPRSTPRRASASVSESRRLRRFARDNRSAGLITLRCAIIHSEFFVRR